MATYIRYWTIFVVALIAPFNTVQAVGGHDSHQGWLVFLNAGPVYNQVTSEDGIQENNFILGSDIIYSYLKGDFRFLGLFRKLIFIGFLAIFTNFYTPTFEKEGFLYPIFSR